MTDLKAIIEQNVVDAYIQRGMARFEMKDTEGAIADFNEAIKLHPQHSEAIYNRTIIRRLNKDNQGSLDDCITHV